MLYHVQVKFQKLESYKLSENVHIDKIMDHLFSSSSLTTSAPSTVRILNRSILDENPSNGLCGPLVEVELTFRLVGTFIALSASCCPFGLGANLRCNNSPPPWDFTSCVAGKKHWSIWYGIRVPAMQNFGLILLFSVELVRGNSSNILPFEAKESKAMLKIFYWLWGKMKL